jgi:3',5'-cyclic AMP phosphodiesterase CpdA
MLLCQISDPHVTRDGMLAYGRVDTPRFLERCVRKILALKRRPDVVVVTGDLTYSGAADEYGTLADLLSPLPMPVYLALGNHDERAAFHAAFPRYRALAGGSEFVQYTVEDFAVRLVVLDTVVPGRPEGELCAARLQWFDATLAAVQRPTLIAQHHPPFVTGMAVMDRMSLAAPELEQAVVARYPYVEQVLCGHYHRTIHARFAGTIASVCPSCAHQLVLQLESDAGLRLTFEPPAFQLHLWNGTQIVSHNEVVDDFAAWGAND